MEPTDFDAIHSLTFKEHRHIECSGSPISLLYRHYI